MQLSGANVLDINFQVQGDRSVIKEMKSEGRSVVNLSAPKTRANDPRARLRLTANSIKLIWRLKAKIGKGEAAGNAELYVEPVQNRTADAKTLALDSTVIS